MQVDDVLAKKVLDVVDAGLVAGQGDPAPGEMCVEAAVCYAMGLPHSDRPPCVSPALRQLKIMLNDARWSSVNVRAKGLRRLAIAQLGSAGILDDDEFVRRVNVMMIRTVIPAALLAVVSLKGINKKHSKSLEDAATLCSRDPSVENALKASVAAHAAAHAYAAHAAAYAAAAYAAHAADAAADVADADVAYAAAADVAYAAADAARAAHAAYAAYADAAHAADAADKLLSEFGENVVQILIEMQAPGTKFLYLTEES